MVNKVMLLGRLGSDPKLAFAQNGNSICNLQLATEDSWKDKEGNKQSRTEWSKVVIFGKLGEICAQYLKKGSTVFVEGSLATREWEKDGQKRYSTEIIAKSVQFLNGKQTGAESVTESQSATEDDGLFI